MINLRVMQKDAGGSVRDTYRASSRSPWRFLPKGKLHVPKFFRFLTGRYQLRLAELADQFLAALCVGYSRHTKEGRLHE